jgi:L-ascorbate metabolism protein UlaG (beta-lactamase superfamily)
MRLLDAVDVSWLGHDSFRLAAEKVVYIDPWHINRSEKADIILVTHEHYDHLSPDDIAKLRGPATEVVAPASAATKLSGQVHTIAPGQAIAVAGVRVEAVPAYNVNKFRSPGHPFHPKAEGKVGYIITLGGVRIYHAGDTDLIPEMDSVRCDIALLPVSGTYVMTAEEAAQAADRLAPRLAIPMHYGSIVGSDADAERFKRLTRVPVQILRPGG